MPEQDLQSPFSVQMQALKIQITYHLMFESAETSDDSPQQTCAQTAYPKPIRQIL